MWSYFLAVKTQNVTSLDIGAGALMRDYRVIGPGRLYVVLFSSCKNPECYISGYRRRHLNARL